MNWIDATVEYHRRTFDHDCRLSSLPEEWQRELAALWRLEADVNNGGYLQFLENWGRESYVYASQALRNIGAHTIADIIDQCEALVEEHVDMSDENALEHTSLTGTKGILPDGTVWDPGEPVLPKSTIDRILRLSYRFMEEYPEDIDELGLRYYSPFIDCEAT
jgi:hypothetical protein